jgi:hypothetical protein
MCGRLLALAVLSLSTVLLAGSTAATAGAPPAARRASCTTTQKAERQAALRAYRKRMSAQRKAYFRAHTSVELRRAFVRRQRARLKKLQVAASCTVAAPAPAPTPTPAPAPVNVTYEFGSEVSSGDQAWPKDVVNYAGSSLPAMTGVTLESFKVFVYANADGLAAAFQKQAGLDASAVPVKSKQYADGNVAAEAGYHGVFVYLGNSTWSQGDALSRQKILAHEMFHLVQEQLEKDPSNCGRTPSDQVRACGPTWLIEGSAETMGYRVAAARGLIDLKSFEQNELAGRVRATSLTLASLETYAGQSQPHGWDTMHLAAVHLANIAPKGIKSFVDFWSAIGAGTPWQQAFQNAFGMSVDAYYANFNAYRAGL